ncbi:MAG: hypothetical protein ACIPMY_00880 [Rickettsia endosymbiont of Pentastiridius leporinus]
MSKNPNLEEKNQELIKRKKEELDIEYQNLSYLEAMWAGMGVNTGNEKYDSLNKEYQELNGNNPGIIQNITNAIGDTASVLQFTWETAQILPDLITEYNNLQAVKSAATEANAIEATCKIIADSESLIKKTADIFHSTTISDTSKETLLNSTIIPYLLTPVLNKSFGGITKNFQISETDKINILENVSPKFIRELATLGVDLVAGALDKDSNLKIQEIFKNTKQKDEQSQTIILQNIYDIITSEKVNNVLSNNLISFLKSSENQKEIVNIAENIINNKVHNLTNPELIASTVELAANSSVSLIKNAPLIIDSFQKFKDYREWSDINLNHQGMSTDIKKELLEAKKPQIIELVKNTKEITNNLSPILKNDLPKYLDANKENLVKFLDHPMVTEQIKSRNLDPKLIHNAANAAIPFLKDSLPLLTELTNATLSKSDEVANIIQKVQLIKTLPKDEKSKEVKELIGSVMQLKNNDPKVKEIVEKKIPEILTKHANSLGPVVEEFLNTTPIGKKLKLDGEKLIKIAGKHVPEFSKIADKYSKREYAGMVIPTMKLLLDPKVLGIIAESIINLGKDKILGPNTQRVIKERETKQIQGRRL